MTSVQDVNATGLYVAPLAEYPVAPTSRREEAMEAPTLRGEEAMEVQTPQRAVVPTPQREEPMEAATAATSSTAEGDTSNKRQGEEVAKPTKRRRIVCREYKNKNTSMFLNI